jgi:hypothetical protein
MHTIRGRKRSNASKLYKLDGTGIPRDRSSERLFESPTARQSGPVTDPAVGQVLNLPVERFFRGLEVRVAQSFRDYDGQEIRAGEVLHFVEGRYFFYDGGHTLVFTEKTIRLADTVDEHQPIIANAGNRWFQPRGRQVSPPAASE